MPSTNPGVDRLAQLNALHLYGMATAWTELLAEGPRRPMQPEAWLDRLIDAERADRQVRSLRYQLKAARFPVHRDLTGIDWAESAPGRSVSRTIRNFSSLLHRRRRSGRIVTSTRSFGALLRASYEHSSIRPPLSPE
jgi:DNA replication protein DnaC